MIKGTQIKQHGTIDRPDVNYRKLAALNVSMIKLFDTDPVKFFEQFKLGRAKKDSKSTALIIGDIVDFYLIDCKGNEDEFDERFEEKFSLYNGVKGSGQVFILADEIFAIAKENLNEDGEVTKEFEKMFSTAFAKVQAAGKYKNAKEEKGLEDFMEKGYDYYKTLIENVDKTVLDISLLEKGKRVARILQEDEFTSDVFTDDNADVEYFPKFPIEWVFSTDETEKEISCKSEIDILKINHHEKMIYLKDLKTTFDNELFDYNYLKNGYYLQAAFYYLAVRQWANENDMVDYEVTPMEFVVGDTSSNNRRPIRYQTSKEDLKAGLYGFSIKGQEYRGIIELVNEISWCEDNNIWNVSKKVFDAKGRLTLNLKYD